MKEGRKEGRGYPLFVEILPFSNNACFPASVVLPPPFWNFHKQIPFQIPQIPMDRTIVINVKTSGVSHSVMLIAAAIWPFGVTALLTSCTRM